MARSSPLLALLLVSICVASGAAMVRSPSAGPAVDPQFAPLYRKVAGSLGDVAGGPFIEDNGNRKQVFAGGYMLLAPDGTIYARGNDNAELARSAYDGEDSAFASVYPSVRDRLGRSLGAAYREANGNLKQDFEGGYMLLAPDGAVYARDAENTELARGGGGPAVLSEITLDTSIVPRSRSTIPGYESEVEQCGEFVYRYFKEQGHGWPDYPTLGQPAEYIRGNARRPEFPAFLNGSTVAPRAGDIVGATGTPGSGIYHTALIWKVDPAAVWVYQANVPLGLDSSNWQDHVGRWPMLQGADGGYVVQPLMPSVTGYRTPIGVTGWIHPTGASRLPGAPE